VSPDVITKLLRYCVFFWALGLVGMWVTRAWFVLDPHALAFQVAAGSFFFGAVGYTGLGILGIVTAERTLAHRDQQPDADLSAWIRRQ